MLCQKSPITISILRIYYCTVSTDAAYSGNATAQSEWISNSEPKSPLVTPDGEEPTDEEVQDLRHVSDCIPLTLWLVAAISLTERFTYYGINSPFRKFDGTSDVLWSIRYRVDDSRELRPKPP